MVLFQDYPDLMWQFLSILSKTRWACIFFHDRKYTHWSTLLGARFDNTGVHSA